MADSKISALTDGSPLVVGDELAIARSGSSLRVFAPPRLGAVELIYRYTVTGSDKTSIDTGVDTADAGSNVWTNCDLIEVVLTARTDESIIESLVDIVLNNDTGSVYDREWNRVIGTADGNNASAVGESSARFGQVPGTSVANTSVVGVFEFKIPNPTGTVFNKVLSGTWGMNDPGDSSNQVATVATCSWRPASPAAVTRLKVIPDTSGKKLKVGSQLLIYKRLAS